MSEHLRHPYRDVHLINFYFFLGTDSQTYRHFRFKN